MAREDEIAGELRKLGLTGYEAKCYVSLVKTGPSDPRRVASRASVPYPSAYEALSRLRDLGWVELVRKRPATYRAREPRTIFAEIQSRLKATFGTLDEMYKAVPAEQTELVYTLRGRERVVSKLVEMIRRARSSVILVTPAETLEESAELMEEVAQAAARGVRVRTITDQVEVGGLPAGVERRTGNIFAFDLLVDDSAALIGLPDLSAAGWVESSAVAAHFMQFLELLWGASKE